MIIIRHYRRGKITKFALTVQGEQHTLHSGPELATGPSVEGLAHPQTPHRQSKTNPIPILKAFSTPPPPSPGAEVLVFPY